MPDAAPGSAVLLMAHGTPESVDQMAGYLRLVRDGREPSAELIREMTHNCNVHPGTCGTGQVVGRQSQSSDDSRL